MAIQGSLLKQLAFIASRAHTWSTKTIGRNSAFKLADEPEVEQLKLEGVIDDKGYLTEKGLKAIGSNYATHSSLLSFAALAVPGIEDGSVTLGGDSKSSKAEHALAAD